MDGNRRRRVISSNENTLFSLWFYLINLHCLGIGVCRDNQSIVGIEKADGTDGVDRADGANKADRVDRTNGANGTDGDGANQSGANGADGVDGADKGGANAKKPNEADGADKTNATDGVDGADGVDRGRANAEKSYKADRSRADAKELVDPGDSGLEDPQAERRKLARQMAIRLSFFSFHIVFCLFFSSSELETCSST